ncbi:MAG: hypothetical protein Q8S53_12090, partial [Brevundimonas sp.]|uniref:hypothetical protein n=1 Tax=Brevundimonas sp. TaxID=1871086 RepID=UPI002736B2B6
LSQAEARLPVMPEDQATIETLFREEAPLRLPASALKRGIVPCAYAFHANRPHQITAALRRAA